MVFLRGSGGGVVETVVFEDTVLGGGVLDNCASLLNQFFFGASYPKFSNDPTFQDIWFCIARIKFSVLHGY